MSAQWTFSSLVALPIFVVLAGSVLVSSPGATPGNWRSAVVAGCLATLALLVESGAAAYATLAMATSVHSWNAWRRAPTGGLYLGAAALALVFASLALMSGAPEAAFYSSCLAIALRAGLAPFHTGVAECCMHARDTQMQQSSTLLALIVAHLRFVDETAAAQLAATPMVVWGAMATLVYALTALAQRDFSTVFRSSTVMHGGMLFAAVGVAAHGHFAAALLVSVTIVLAMGGLASMLIALENRVGPLHVAGQGTGRARAFPRLAAACAFFSGASVGMPFTAGFIADDVLLHALWEHSAAAAIAVILGSSLLAVATLKAFCGAFFGQPMPVRAQDLGAQERLFAIAVIALLVGLGLAPQVLVGAAEQLLATYGH